MTFPSTTRSHLFYTFFVILIFCLLVKDSSPFHVGSSSWNTGSKIISVQTRNKMMATTNTHVPPCTTCTRLSNTADNDDGGGDGTTTTKGGDAAAKALKDDLIQKITEFRELKIHDGDVSIDFGVKGGELNSTSRAPQKVDFYGISMDVGNKAAEIISVCEELAKYNPIEEPTKYIGSKENGELAPLNGPWKSLFSTAADANFSKNSTRGAAKAQNIVNGTKGIITNVIDFETNDDGSEPLLKQLNVVIKATAVNAKRIELQFKYAKAVLTKFFFWKVKWNLYIPVPGPFITRCIVLISRILKFGRKAGAKKVPKGYFDVLYLDKDLRIHRTGEDNMFVQARESWNKAQKLLA